MGPPLGCQVLCALNYLHMPLVKNCSVCVGFVFCLIFVCLFSLHGNSEAKEMTGVHTEAVACASWLHSFLDSL